jgi:drug/metabolite transporter (DMT)-like permease
MAPLVPDPRKGVLLMVGAGLCWSTGGLFVRNVTLADPWEIVLWRSLFMVVFLAGTIIAMHRSAALAKVHAVGRSGVLSGLLLASTFFFFIGSITHTTVANTLALMSTGPLFVALAGRAFLGETVHARTWAAIAVALAGIALMFAEGLDGGRTAGNLLALGVPIAFALNVVVLRRTHADIDMVPAVMLAGLFSIVFAAPLALPLQASASDVATLAGMGILQLGLGCLLMTLATRHLPAGEIGLFALLETILGPLWVWLGVGERPSDLAIVGGAVVVGAVVANHWASSRAAARAAATAGC